MPRPPRIIVPRIPHHVTHRSSHQKNLFFSYFDRIEYLAILKKQCLRTGLIVDGFCLMDNHVHLIVTPPTEESLSSAIGQTACQFSRAKNLHKKLTGHVWERRFYSCPMDDSHYISALLYVDYNPVRAGLVESPADWLWSSAKAHLGGDDFTGLIDPHRWKKLSQKIGWAELMEQSQDSVFAETIERYTETSRPLGDKVFLRRIEKILGYPVGRRESAGRPGKSEKG